MHRETIMARSKAPAASIAHLMLSIAYSIRAWMGRPTPASGLVEVERTVPEEMDGWEAWDARQW